MTDYPYDPDLPYVVAQRRSNDEDDAPVGSINARFRHERSAEEYVNEFLHGYVELIDTTPAPKIPADAEFIHWFDGDSFWYARRTPFVLWEDDCGEERDVAGMLESIGDAEVVVLRRV